MSNSSTYTARTPHLYKDPTSRLLYLPKTTPDAPMGRETYGEAPSPSLSDLFGEGFPPFIRGTRSIGGAGRRSIYSNAGGGAVEEEQEKRERAVRKVVRALIEYDGESGEVVKRRIDRKYKWGVMR